MIPERLRAARILAGFACVAPGLVLAQGSGPAVATALPGVTVTATGNPVRVQDALAATTIIDRSQIEQSQATDVTALLRDYAGIDIGANGGPGQLTSLFTRGGASTETLVLVDGVRVNHGTAGGPAIQNISTGMIERIEVVSGPRSTVYGSDAVAGVINIITRQGGQPQAQVSVGGGTQNTYDASADFGTGGQRWRFAGGVEQQHTGGIPSCQSSDVDRPFGNRSVHGKGDLAVGPVTLSASAWDSEGHAAYEEFCGEPFVAQDQDFQNQAVSVSASAQPLRDWTSELTFSRGLDRIAQRDAGSPGTDNSGGLVRTIRPEVAWRNVITALPFDRITLGIDAYREHADSLSFGSAYHSAVGYNALMMEHELQKGPWRAVLAGTVFHYTTFNTQAVWNAELGYDVLRGTRLVAAAGTGFRAPNADDRFGFGGNPNLQPERSHSYEFGVHQQIGTVQSLDVRAFRISYTNQILVIFDGNPQAGSFGFQAVNVDRSRSDGITAAYQLNNELWDVLARVTWQNPVDRAGIAQDPSDAGKQLLRRSKHNEQFSLTRTIGPAYVGADVYSQGRRRDIDASSGGEVFDGGYALVGFRAGTRLMRVFALEARVQNAFNHHYQTAAGYNQMGTSAMLTLRYTTPAPSNP